MFYDPSKTFSHNCILNFVTSDRGAGKTYSTLKYLIKKYESKNEQFVWLRRTAKECDLIKKNLFSALEAGGEFDKGTYKVEGVRLMKGEKQFGGLLPLSTSTQYKSIAWPDVKTIVFDEFIEEKGRYLKNEVQNLLSIMETVGRMRDIRVVLLANSITKYNPYYTYFDIKTDLDREFIKDRKRGILIHNWHSEEYRNKKSETKFAKLLEGTEYGEFMFKNSNILDKEDYIKKSKSKKKTPIMTFVFEDENFCCWYVEDKTETFVYITRGENKSAAYAVNFDETLRESYIWSNRKGGFAKHLKTHASRGNLYFENGSVKNTIMQLLKELR